VLISSIVDFDILFSKYAKNNNHRMLISHSIIPSILLLILGLLFLSPLLIICAFAYFIHILIDTMDWGTNFFGINKEPFGPKFLISNKELENLSEILNEYKVAKSFFDFRYYKNKTVLIIEGLLFAFMIIFIVWFAFEYLIVISLFFFGLIFHLFIYYKLKKIESNKNDN